MAWSLVKYGLSLIGLFAAIFGPLLFLLQGYTNSTDVLVRQLRNQGAAGNKNEGLCTFNDNGCMAVKLANCTSGTCDGTGIVYVPCTAENCPAIWSEWVMQTKTNSTICTRNRHRNCTNIQNVPDCNTYQTRSVTCNTSVWSAWSDWQCTQIEKSCMAKRTRRCYSGLDNASCNGTKYEEVACTVSRCLGQAVSFWNEWSDHKCFYEQNSCLHVRNRTCSSGVNNDCEGKYYHVSGDCSKNCYGNWSNWSGWVCKAGGRVYTAQRSRNCTAEAPKICKGSPNELFSCGPDPCPVCNNFATLNVTKGPNDAANFTTWKCFEANGIAYRIRYSTLCSGTDCQKQENYELDWCNIAKCPDCYNGSTPIVNPTDPPKLDTVTGVDSTDNPWDHWKCLNDTVTGLMFRVEHKDCNTTYCVGENHALQPCNELECPECFPNTGQGNEKCYDEIGTSCTSLNLPLNKCEDPVFSAKCRKTCKLCGSSQIMETTIAISETTTTRSSTINSAKPDQTEAVTFSTINTSLTTEQASATNLSLTTSKDLTTVSTKDISTRPYLTTSKDLTTDSSKDITTKPSLTTSQDLTTKFSHDLSTKPSLTTIIDLTSNETTQSTSKIAEAVSTTSSRLTSSMKTTTFTTDSSTDATLTPTDTTTERLTTSKASEVITNSTNIFSEASVSSTITTRSSITIIGTTDSSILPFTTADKIGVDACFDDPSIACNAFGGFYCKDANTAWTKCRKTCNLCDSKLPATNSMITVTQKVPNIASTIPDLNGKISTISPQTASKYPHLTTQPATHSVITVTQNVSKTTGTITDMNGNISTISPPSASEYPHLTTELIANRTNAVTRAPGAAATNPAFNGTITDIKTVSTITTKETNSVNLTTETISPDNVKSSSFYSITTAPPSQSTITAGAAGSGRCFDESGTTCVIPSLTKTICEDPSASQLCRKTCKLCDDSSSTQSVSGHSVTWDISREAGISTLNPNHLSSDNPTTTYNPLIHLTTDSLASSKTTNIYITKPSLTSSSSVSSSKASSPTTPIIIDPNTPSVDLSMTTANYPTNITSYPNITSITNGSLRHPQTTFIPVSTTGARVTRTNKPTVITTPQPASTTKTTTQTPTSTVQTGHTIPPTPTKCAVCFGPPELCDELYEIQTCPAPDNYCINHIKNYDDGSRSIERGCGSHTRCYREWFQGSSDDDKCQNFMEDNVITLEFECTYCCIKDECNIKMYPALDTLYKDV